MQGQRVVLNLLNEGLASILHALKSYQQHSVILRAWQDVFVDLVQGHVQHLFLSLLEGGLLKDLLLLLILDSPLNFDRV